MGLASACYAERCNRVKEDWAAKLRAAIDTKDWAKATGLLKELETYYFGE